MNAGSLRHYVAIQQPPNTRDTQGGLDGDWRTIPDGCCWAKITPVSGSRRYDSAQIVQGVTHEIVIRYRSDLTSDMRILHGTRAFAFKSLVNVDERDREIRILAEEVTA